MFKWWSLRGGWIIWMRNPEWCRKLVPKMTWSMWQSGKSVESKRTLRSIEIPLLAGLTENAGHEIAGHENTGHEFARQDKYRMKKIDYITLECALLLNFKFFVCKASVLTYIKQLRLLIINIAVFSDLYTPYCRKLFAAATNFKRFVVNVAY